ncbi:MAG TPA: DUF4139 domain-containing protein [Geobacteraceae bacterium]
MRRMMRIAPATLLLATTILVAPAAAAGPALLATTQADRQGLALTVYNNSLGLVRDLRQLALPAGTSELRFMDVAAQIIPASVQVRSLPAVAGLRVLEQNYEYDLLNPQKLLDKYVGKEVKLYQKNPYSEREEMVTATLLANSGGPVFKIGNEVTFGHPGRLIFPGVPDNLIAKPTLVWLLQHDAAATRQLEASYLTEGIGWRADYVLSLAGEAELADLSGWVTIDNRSGASYPDATLKLVAGDVNRVREEPRVMAKTMRVGMADAAPQFREQELFEYHLYTLERPATIKENQAKQLRLLSAAGLPVSREYLLRGAAHYYQSPQGEPGQPQKVAVYLQFDNRAQYGLGLPLPKGTVRVYQRDADASLQFVGEDSIDHTPKDEKVRLKVGEAFDLVATRKQTDWRKLANDSYEAAFQITIRNHKKEAVTVRVLEPVPGDWQMVDSSHPHDKVESATAQFLVPVAKDGEAKLTYRVKMRY